MSSTEEGANGPYMDGCGEMVLAAGRVRVQDTARPYRMVQLYFSEARSWGQQVYIMLLLRDWCVLKLDGYV